MLTFYCSCCGDPFEREARGTLAELYLFGPEYCEQCTPLSIEERRAIMNQRIRSMCEELKPKEEL